MTQKEIDCQRKAVEALLKRKGLSAAQMWDCWNYVLNIARQACGKPLVNRLNNPYLKPDARERIIAEVNF